MSKWRVYVQVGDETVIVDAEDEDEAGRKARAEVDEMLREDGPSTAVIDVRPWTPTPIDYYKRRSGMTRGQEGGDS